MASKSYSISFNVLGNLDASLLNALKNASDRIRSLNDLARSVNARAIAQAKKLDAAQKKLADVEKFDTPHA